MSLLAQILGRVRGLTAGNFGEDREDERFHMNPRGDMLVAQGLPELTEIVRMGDSWAVMGPAVALVTALPTVAAGLSLWNGEPATGKTYVIDSVGIMDVVVDAAQSDHTAIVAMLNATPVDKPADAALTIRSLSGRSKYGGKARTLSLGAVTDDGWLPLGDSAPPVPVAAGSAWKVKDVPVRGLYQVPPGGMFSIAGIKVAAAAAGSRYFIRWHEALLPVRTS